MAELVLLANDTIPTPPGLSGPLAAVFGWLVAIVVAVKFVSVDIVGQWRQSSRAKHAAELDKLRLERIKLWYEIEELKRKTNSNEVVTRPDLADVRAVPAAASTEAARSKTQPPEPALPAIADLVNALHKRQPRIAMPLAAVLCAVFLGASLTLFGFGAGVLQEMYVHPPEIAWWLLVPNFLIFFVIPFVFMSREAIGMVKLLWRWLVLQQGAG